MLNHPILLHVQETSGSASYRTPRRCFTLSRHCRVHKCWPLNPICQQIGVKACPSSSIGSIFRRVLKICEKRLLFLSCLSVQPHDTTRLLLDGFSWSLIFEYFSKICRENPIFIKIRQKQWVPYMKTNTHFWSHLAHFFLEVEMFQIKSRRENETRSWTLITFFRKSCRLWGNVEKYCRVWQTRHDNMVHAYCRMDT